MAKLRLRFSVGLSILCGVATGQEVRDFREVIPNWRAPSSWSRSEAKEGEAPLEARAPAAASLPTSPLPFIGVKPCRIVDTRSTTFPPGYGTPSLVANMPRDIALAGQCGIPLDAQAVSLNITVTGAQGNGYILIYPYGSNPPGVSTLNYATGQTVANAAVVSLGNGGISVMAVVSGTQLLIDTNGYYAAAGSGFLNTFLGEAAGNFTMTGGVNTGIGANALAQNTTGFWNTALGESALYFNTEGQNNAACGRAALYSNTTGSDNTAVGNAALFPNVDGSNNTAVGSGALQIGGASGSFNTALGITALIRSSGSYNTALGWYSGADHRNGDHNIYLGSPGANTESGVIRIGDLYSSKTFVASIRGVVTDVADAVPVMIDQPGQLGTVSSSARFKEEIDDMADGEQPS